MRVFLDAGHGGTDPGAVFKRFREKDVTLAIVLELRRLMEAEGSKHVCSTSRMINKNVTLGDRVRLAKGEHADVFLSVHCNADPDDDAPGKPEASGAEVWVHPKSQGGHRLAKLIAEGFTEGFVGYPWRGIRESEHLYVLKVSPMTACLVEVGFIDSIHDADFLSRPEVVTKIARLLLAALDAFSAQP